MDERLRALERSRYVSLTTYRRDGRSVATPVWFAIDGARVLVWTEVDSGKAKRVRATRRVTVAACDARGKITGPSYEGTARVLPAADFDASNRTMNARYRLLKPVVEAWHSLTLAVRRKPRPVEVFVEVLLAEVAT